MASKEENKALIERFPFLLPRNRWTDEIPDDFNYDYTELDAMPNGWRIAFGEQMCEEIAEALLWKRLLQMLLLIRLRQPCKCRHLMQLRKADRFGEPF